MATRRGFLSRLWRQADEARRRPLAFLLLSSFLLLPAPPPAQAGDIEVCPSGEVTCREYWSPHEEWLDNSGEPGSWYIEPSEQERVANVYIEDDFSNALGARVYMDLWRNHREDRWASVRFRLNGGPVRKPEVGDEWSRTPWVGEVELSQLRRGKNEFRFLEEGWMHVHDVCIRIDYEAEHPLAGEGDLTPPEGRLVNTSELARPDIDSNRLTLEAEAGSEFCIGVEPPTLPPGVEPTLALLVAVEARGPSPGDRFPAEFLRNQIPP